MQNVSARMLRKSQAHGLMSERQRTRSHGSILPIGAKQDAVIGAVNARMNGFRSAVLTIL